MPSTDDANINPTRVDRRRRLCLQAAACGGLTLLGQGVSAATRTGPRKLAFLNLHTGEARAVTYWRDGGYDQDALAEVAHVLRDHRADESAPIDTRLLDLLHVLHAGLDTRAPFHVISGYRSPRTNERLRQRGAGVAKRSLHMQGKAIDIRVPGVDNGDLYRAALALRGGGVGRYSKSDFVHLDVGRVRTWGR